MYKVGPTRYLYGSGCSKLLTTLTTFLNIILGIIVDDVLVNIMAPFRRALKIKEAGGPTIEMAPEAWQPRQPSYLQLQK